MPLRALRRFPLLLVLLTQLPFLGLGRGMVVCIAPGGHVRVEAAASACCAEPVADAGEHGAGLWAARDGRDCRSCSDVRIALDPRVSKTRVSKRSGARGAGDSAVLAGALFELPAPPSADRAPRFGRRAPGGSAPPHLKHLRSIVLRC